MRQCHLRCRVMRIVLRVQIIQKLLIPIMSDKCVIVCITSWETTPLFDDSIYYPGTINDKPHEFSRVPTRYIVMYLNERKLRMEPEPTSNVPYSTKFINSFADVDNESASWKHGWQMRKSAWLILPPTPTPLPRIQDSWLGGAKGSSDCIDTELVWYSSLSVFMTFAGCTVESIRAISKKSVHMMLGRKHTFPSRSSDSNPVSGLSIRIALCSSVSKTPVPMSPCTARLTGFRKMGHKLPCVQVSGFRWFLVVSQVRQPPETEMYNY